jgi:hypothetical protein
MEIENVMFNHRANPKIPLPEDFYRTVISCTNLSGC